MGDLIDAIQKDRGQPSTVRIGTVVSVNPVLIAVQGTNFSNVGLVGGQPLAVGATVALLGQSAVSADGSSWLALGGVTAAALPPVQSFVQEIYTTNSTAYTVAGPVGVCGVAFTVPPSGAVMLHWSAEINHGTSFCVLSPQVATGSTLAAGTVITATSDDRTVRNDASAVTRSACAELISSLTPGQSLNATLYHRVGAGTGTIGRRRLLVVPV